jgi:hypothetical protein
MTVLVLDKMQMLDQQIAAARPICKQRLHIGQSGRVNLTALGRTAWLTATIAPAAAFAVGARWRLNIHFLAPRGPI